MPLPASLELDGISGSSEIKQREGQSEVYGFNHEVFIPTDRATGKAVGGRVHKQFTVIKIFDKASPVLYDFCCQGKVIPTVTVHWYEVDPMGSQKEYFTHTLTEARVVSVRPYMPDTHNPQYDRYQHMEEVAFRYEEIEWQFLEGGVIANDRWTDVSM